MCQKVGFWWPRNYMTWPFLSSTIASRCNARIWGTVWPGRVMERKTILYLSENLKHLDLFSLAHMSNNMEKPVDSNLVASHFIVHSFFVFFNPFTIFFCFSMLNGIHYINEMSHLVTMGTFFLQPAKNELNNCHE